MSYQKLLSESIAFANSSACDLHNTALRSDLRSRTAAACFAIAQQHHASILLLLSQRRPLEATAMALLRPLLEAVLRGLWVRHCAGDDQVERFLYGGKKQVDMASVISQLSQLIERGTAGDSLYRNMWPLLSSLTHSYEHQVRSWMISPDVESGYPIEEIQWLIDRANDAFRLAVAGVRGLQLPV